MATLERAIEIAAKAHAGQKDKAGTQYILHPLRVMLRVSTPDERIAAVLHDVVEDTSVTLEGLRAEGFSEEVIAAIDALTKRTGETRIDAAKRAATNPIARIVKLADNAENMDLSRIRYPTEKDLQRIGEYQAVRSVLEVTPQAYGTVEQAADIFGLPIGSKVSVTFKGGRGPELVGKLEVAEQVLFLADRADSNLALRIGCAVFRRHDIESCHRLSAGC
jgi:guanosine-3',5'-bis(diphosphate) 3'-pyrophosphohydrolase